MTTATTNQTTTAPVPLRWSVALCTCNGAGFLPEQLASYVAQTRRPDELVVCDDASTDATLSLLETFAAEAPFPVRIERNAERLGVSRNFALAVRLCTGDVIALSDQDDRWLPHKLERITAMFESSRAVHAVFSDADLVNGHGQPTGRRLWESVGFLPAHQEAVRRGQAAPMLLRSNFVTGATLAVRAELRDVMLPIPPIWGHEQWMALLAATFGELRMIAEPLIQYRLHERQQIGLRPMPLDFKARQANRRKRRTERQERARDYWQRVRSSPRSTGLWAPLVANLEARLTLPESRWRRAFIVLRELMTGRYGWETNPWKTAWKDLFWR
jgi:glycosyltransferase involved in cell wall biosynthesis